VTRPCHQRFSWAHRGRLLAFGGHVLALRHLRKRLVLVRWPTLQPTAIPCRNARLCGRGPGGGYSLQGLSLQSNPRPIAAAPMAMMLAAAPRGSCGQGSTARRLCADATVDSAASQLGGRLFHVHQGIICRKKSNASAKDWKLVPFLGVSLGTVPI